MKVLKAIQLISLTSLDNQPRLNLTPLGDQKQPDGKSVETLLEKGELPKRENLNEKKKQADVI